MKCSNNDQIGAVGTNYSSNSTFMTNLYETIYKNFIELMSHSHLPPGGHPSYNVNGKDEGDLNNAHNSPYNYKREAYDVSRNKIYEYSKSTYFPYKGEGKGNSVPYFDKVRQR
jgi:hypothetical protein